MPLTERESTLAAAGSLEQFRNWLLGAEPPAAS